MTPIQRQPERDSRKLLRLLAAATELVHDWDEHPCPRCGGTGVAYDWPAAMALRDAIQDQPYVGGHPEMPLHPYVPTGDGECQNCIDTEVAKLAAELINDADMRGGRDFDVSEALTRAERLRERLKDALLWLVALPFLLVYGGPGVGGNPDSRPPPPPPRDRS